MHKKAENKTPRSAQHSLPGSDFTLDPVERAYWESQAHAICERSARNRRRFGDRFPVATLGGRYRLSEDSWWIGGFWNGLQNLCYELSGNPEFLQGARASWQRHLTQLDTYPEKLDHDIGFLYQPSFVADYKLSGSPDARSVALRAADLLAARFNPKGNFLQCWNVWRPSEVFSQNNRGRIIVDSLYNLPLLFWSSEESGDENYHQIAEAHAETCLRHLVRRDASTFHTFVFDPDTGTPRFGETKQGLSDDSCWARGQAWAIGGFAQAHAYTGKPAFLEAARDCADYFLANTPEGKAPPWDFCLEKPEEEPLDTSAAAIAAVGLFMLSETGDPEEALLRRHQALRLLRTLATHYSALSIDREEGLLLHACGFRLEQTDIDCSLIYGDYFFLEAICRALGVSKGYW